MDENPGPAATRGGAVEPANRAAVAKERFQTPAIAVGERYEHRDPFADVTYRVKTFQEMVAKAEQLGTSRFYAISEEGKRTPINKVNGVWQRNEGPLLQIPSSSTVEERSSSGRVVSITGSMKPPAVDLARIESEAEHRARAERLEAALAERYIIKRASVRLGEMTLGQTEYRYRGDTSRVAFTETTFRLATDNNSPSVARSMVDVTQARNWQGLRVSGHEDFKRMVWLEASQRGVKALGYEPQAADLEVLKREREARQVNRIEPMPREVNPPTTASDSKQSARGGGGRKAVLAALEAVLVAKHVPERQREAVMAAATESLARRIAAGQTHKVKVFDRTADPQRPATRPAPEQQRTRERATPVR
jgi:Large polyvalent protein-associated domain 7